MQIHDYMFDINYISFRSNEQSNSLVEGFSLQLDDFISDQDSLSPETEKLINMTINFLKEVIQDELGYSREYSRGYRAGQEDCDC